VWLEIPTYIRPGDLSAGHRARRPPLVADDGALDESDAAMIYRVRAYVEPEE
jgi:hypothetical protein